MITAGGTETQLGAPVAGAASRRRALGALWAARGGWGGLLACAIATVGQLALLGGNGVLAQRLYLAAGVLLIAALAHPEAAAWRAGRAASPIPVAPPDAGAVIALAPPEPLPIWTRWTARRAALGWRGTVPGLVLTVGLAAAAAIVLLGDIANPLGGWLWAAALAVLLLTCVGAPAWPPGAGLLPDPRGDFFVAGLPRIRVRVEVVLAVALIGLALLLRLVNLETLPGVFGDEGERGMDARAIVDGKPALIFGTGWWGVPNLYFYGVAWMLRLFGDHSMTGDRMLSVVSGVAAVWFAYRIGRLLWGPRAGLIAGALLAVSPLALQFSRIAGESTPTGALWAAGLFFLLRALRDRRPLDWVLAGMLSGFSLYFYAAGKLIIPLLAVMAVYCLIRRRRAFFTRYALGFALLGGAFALTFLPYALFSIQDHWLSFLGRAQETSIFSPQNQVQAFARYGIPYDPQWATGSLIPAMLAHPQAWARLLYEQLRVTTEVLYRSGDPTAFYQIRIHGGSMLAPLLAALTLLGLAYALWKIWDPRFGLLSLWFWGGLLGAVLTMDTPSVQRLADAWPVILLFPAALLDRIAAGAWPLSPALARRWLNVPLAALLIFAGVDGAQEYFGHYMSLCPYCTATVQARYAEGLGQDYQAYQFGVGGNDIYFTYGPTRFLAKDVAGADMAVPADYFPVTDNDGKGAAFLVYPSNADYLPLIRMFYPGGAETVQRGSDGSAQFTSYEVSAAQMAQFQALTATYAPPSGPAITRLEPNLGTVPAAGAWAPPAGLTYPATATWEGGLVAPRYALYTLALDGGADARLAVDGQVVLDAQAGARQIDLVLARGVHDVRLSGTLDGPGAPLAVRWAATGSPLVAVAAGYLYQGTTGGLSGAVWPGTRALTAPDFGTGVPAARRSDAFFGFREARSDTDSFGQGPFTARWQGTLAAPSAGRYDFTLRANGAGLLLIDGQPVVSASADGNEGSVMGSVTLAAGPHVIDLRYAWQSGQATLEWYWTPPGGAAALVPPTVLRPAARSWPRGAVPDPAGAAAVNVAPAPPPAAAAPPDAVLAGDAGLKEPRGVAVDAQGNLYVGDSGNFRVVRLSPDGRVLGSWGAQTDAAAPGRFGLLADLATGPDGHVVTLDADTGDVQIFDATGRLLHEVPHVSSHASGIAVAPDGRIWVADTGDSRLVRLTVDGAPDGTFTGAPAGDPTRFEQPIDVTFAPDGTPYVVDLRGRIMRLDVQGNIAAQWPVDWGGTRGGSHLAYWQNQVVMSDPDRQRLTVLDPATGTIHFAGTAGSGPGQFQLPIGLAVGPDNRLYVVDSDNRRIQVFSSLGAP